MQVRRRRSAYIHGFYEDEARIRGLVWKQARIYAGSVKKRCVWNLEFAEVCGRKYLICFAVLSVNDVFLQIRVV